MIQPSWQVIDSGSQTDDRTAGVGIAVDDRFRCGTFNRGAVDRFRPSFEPVNMTLDSFEKVLEGLRQNQPFQVFTVE
jgi:hypothetical protein